MSFTTTGIDELTARFRSADEKLQKKIGKKAVRAGGKIILDAERAAAPSRTALTIRALKMQTQKVPKGSVAVRISLSSKVYKEAGRWSYGSFILHGFHHGRRPSTGRKLIRALAGRVDTRKFTPANNFEDRAFRATADKAGAAMDASLIEQIQQAFSE